MEIISIEEGIIRFKCDDCEKTLELVPKYAYYYLEVLKTSPRLQMVCECGHPVPMKELYAEWNKKYGKEQ